jgi:hypothetical protein
MSNEFVMQMSTNSYLRFKQEISKIYSVFQRFGQAKFAPECLI